MPHAVTADELLAAALEILRGGGLPLPCKAGGKRPVTLHSFHDAPNTERGVRAWFTGTAYNLAEPTGLPGRFDVLDVDNHGERGNGWAAFNRLKEAGLLAGAVRIVRTPSGGLHVGFAASEQRCGSLPGHHLDFKGRGGYVLVPPSQVGGRRYEVLDERPPTGVAFDWEAAKRLLSPPKPVPARGSFRRGPGSVRHLPDWITRQGVGNRNKALYWAACRAAEAGNEPVLIELVDAGVHAGLDRAEALRTVVSAARKVNGDVR
jgi:hypothetical protein